MGKTNILELNGKKYDANTGKLLNNSSQKAAGSGKFVKKKTTNKKVFNDIKYVKHPTKTANIKTVAPIQPAKKVHPTAKITIPHKPTPSKTLMRSAVKKPALRPRVETPTKPNTTKTISANIKKVVNTDRLSQAQQITKNALVSRFGTLQDVTYTRINSLQKRSNRTTLNTKSNIAPPKKTRTEKILDEGLARAESHKQTYAQKGSDSKQTSKKFHIKPSIVIAIVFVLVISSIAFVAYINRPLIDIRIASARSGIAAQLPQTIPQSYSYAPPMKYAQNQVVITYASKVTKKSFTIIQQASSWDSSLLLQNFVIILSPTYKTVESNGLTIYLYGNGNATWVNAGIKYQISGSANLTNSQLIAIATSL